MVRWTAADFAEYSRKSDAARKKCIEGFGTPQQFAKAVEKWIGPVPSVRKQTDEEKLNKTEKAYLAVLRSLGVKNLGIQSITLKIADDCRFTPDFNYVDESERTVLIDVKGWQREDAFIKIKVAARIFTQFKFQIVKKDKNIGWDVREIKP